MKHILIIALVIFGLMACEEYFEPDIDAQQSYYVFDGLITNMAGPQKVRITKTLAYNENATYTKVLDATTVAIEEKDGRTIVLTLGTDSAGYYVSDSSITGIINNQYRLHAVMADGKEYYSEYETLLDAAPMDTLTGEYYKKTVVSSDESDDYTEETVDGIRVLNASYSSGYTPYYRYVCNMVYQTAQIYPSQPPLSGMAAYIYRPATSYGNLFIANGADYADNYITNNPLFFSRRSVLYLEYPNLIPDRTYDLEQCGVIFKAKQYALTSKAYSYWKAISDQQNASNYLFDPVESQIEGNMNCASDTSELVFGFFGASAVTEKVRAFALNSENEVVSRYVSYFPDLDSVYVDTLDVPDFFINFY